MGFWGSGAASKIACAFTPLMPKELVPAQIILLQVSASYLTAGCSTYNTPCQAEAWAAAVQSSMI